MNQEPHQRISDLGFISLLVVPALFFLGAGLGNRYPIMGYRFAGALVGACGLPLGWLFFALLIRGMIVALIRSRERDEGS